MSTQEPGRAPQAPALTSLPRLEDIPPMQGGGLDPDRVREAFDSFRRHALQLQAQLRVLQAAGKSANVDPTGHAVRMDSLHLIRAAAEFADALERDAQTASAAQMTRAEEEIRRGQRELQEREAEIERYRDESERQRAEIVNAAKNEARELLANANRDATAEVREAEARANRLLEQARHNATELTNAARAEVEQTLEWARQQASAIMTRAQQGAEQLLTAAGLGPDAMADVVDSIVRAADAATVASRGEPRRPAEAIAQPPAAVPAPAVAEPPVQPAEPDPPAATPVAVEPEPPAADFQPPVSQPELQEPEFAPPPISAPPSSGPPPVQDEDPASSPDDGESRDEDQF
jgi:F0F1-type ATP synthase membrane subunit b/b'